VRNSFSFRSVGSLFHARGAVIRRRVHGTARLPDDEARNVDRPGISATGVNRSEKSGVWPSNDLSTSKHNLYWIHSATGNRCKLSDSRGHTVTWLEIKNGTCHGVLDSLKWCTCRSLYKNEQSKLRSYSTKSHQICTRCRQIHCAVNATIDVPLR